MNIYFSAKTNKEYAMVNKAYFQTKDGQTVGIDRLDTDYTVSNDGTLTMTWSNCYLWEIDGINPFNSEEESMTIYNDRMLKALLDGARFKYLELEDDADDDYEVTDVKAKLDVGNPKFEVETRGGTLIAEAGTDPSNPGISVCYRPNGTDDEVDVVYIENTDPLLLTAKGNEANDIRILTYTDPWTEEYTRSAVLKDSEVRIALDSEEDKWYSFGDKKPVAGKEIAWADDLDIVDYDYYDPDTSELVTTGVEPASHWTWQYRERCDFTPDVRYKINSKNLLQIIALNLFVSEEPAIALAMLEIPECIDIELNANWDEEFRKDHLSYFICRYDKTDEWGSDGYADDILGNEGDPDIGYIALKTSGWEQRLKKDMAQKLLRVIEKTKTDIPEEAKRKLCLILSKDNKKVH